MKQIEAKAEAEEDSDSADDFDAYPDFIDGPDADSDEEEDSDDKSDDSDDEKDSDDESDNSDESGEPKRTVRAPARYRSAHAEAGSSANVRVVVDARRRRNEKSVTVVEVEGSSNRVGEDSAESVEVEDRVHDREYPTSGLLFEAPLINTFLDNEIHKAAEAADAISLTTALLEEEKMFALESARVEKAVRELKMKTKSFQKKLDRVAYRDYPLLDGFL
ncbi:uncharacterized protein LOC113334068 [Papaver somniferum]|uniref:uncharacterized protein LOC113334068 n=1 Tax=Papaver somniferum TaxID=3469 RepID=UPI000E6F78C5|nr:uncharacterized protein LOC113334068 [Papaver somniferum]